MSKVDDVEQFNRDMRIETDRYNNAMARASVVTQLRELDIREEFERRNRQAVMNG